MRPGEVPGKGLGGMLLRVRLWAPPEVPAWPCLPPQDPRLGVDLLVQYSEVNANTYLIPYACRMECDPSVVPQA